MGVCLSTEFGWSLLVVALGGAVGGALRYGVGQWVTRRSNDSFPWGTLVVNTSGAFLIGVLAGWLWADDLDQGINLLLTPGWSLLVVGLLGSYTTVSAFSLQTLALYQQKRQGLALLNIVLSMSLSLVLATLGWNMTASLGGPA